MTLLGLMLCVWPWVSPLVWASAISLGVATKGDPDDLNLLHTGVGAIGMVVVSIGYKREHRTARPLMATVAFVLGFALAFLPTMYFLLVFFLFVVLPVSSELL